MKYGYPWVSTESQKNNSSIKAQKEEFIKAGVPEENIRVEVESGANEIRHRPVFQNLLTQELKSDHILMVTKVDRYSRNRLEFLKLQDVLFKKILFLLLWICLILLI
jgi:DNA invertase Pin-like site-specific DNA recombinase